MQREEGRVHPAMEKNQKNFGGYSESASIVRRESYEQAMVDPFLRSVKVVCSGS